MKVDENHKKFDELLCRIQESLCGSTVYLGTKIRVTDQGRIFLDLKQISLDLALREPKFLIELDRAINKRMLLISRELEDAL
jgi:hypothetical protein